MTDPSGTPSPPAGPGDDTAYAAVWTRRVVVSMALLGVAVLIGALVWASTRPGHTDAASKPNVGPAGTGNAVQGSAGTTSTIATAPSSSTTARTPTSTEAGHPGSSIAPSSGVSSTAPPRTAPATTTTLNPNRFYNHGTSVSTCLKGFSPGGSATGGSPSSPPIDAQTQAVTDAGCLVHAWAWKLTTSDSRAGMDSLASSHVIPTLLTLGDYLEQLQLAPGGCTLSGAAGNRVATCTFTDGTTNVVLTLLESPAYTYGWLASDVTWGPVAPPPPLPSTTTTTTTAAMASTTTPLPSSATTPKTGG